MLYNYHQIPIGIPIGDNRKERVRPEDFEPNGQPNGESNSKTNGVKSQHAHASSKEVIPPFAVLSLAAPGKLSSEARISFGILTKFLIKTTK